MGGGQREGEERIRAMGGMRGLFLGGKVRVAKQVLLLTVLFVAVVYPPAWLQVRRVQMEVCLFLGGGETEGGEKGAV